MDNFFQPAELPPLNGGDRSPEPELLGTFDYARPDVEIDYPGYPRAEDAGIADAQEPENPDIVIPVPPQGLGELSTQTTVHYGSTPSGESADLPAAPNDGGDHDGPPPLDTSTAESDNPNRGRALQQLMDFVGTSGHKADQRLIREILENTDEWELPDPTVVADMSPQEIIDSAASVDRETLDDMISRIVDEDLTSAEILYREQAQAAGVQLEMTDIADIELRMTDPAAFSAAVGQLEAPATEKGQADLQDHMLTILDKALGEASATILKDNPEATAAAVGGHLTLDLLDATTGPAIPEDRAFTAALAKHAGTLAQGLTDARATDELVAPISALAQARTDDMAVEWAVGFAKRLMADPEERLPDIYATGDDWSPVYDYLTHLRDTAPDKHFTHTMRDGLLQRIDETLAQLDPGSDGSSRYAERGSAYQVEDYHAIADVLKIARHRIRQIFFLND